MVDEGSTFEETCGETRNAEVGMRSEGRGRNLECGNLLSLCAIRPTGQLELSRRQYHVFARAPDRDRSTIRQTPSDELWTYVAAIHRKSDAIAVSVGLVQSGMALEAEVAVIAQSPGPLAGKVLIIHREGSGLRQGV
jgi:hypothetical protein